MTLNPALIPNGKKKAFLLGLSEDDFRDQVVRPLFILKGLRHGKDLCGPTEDGKDCYFYCDDPVRGTLVYAIQTKSGDLKMSAAAKDNVLNALTQVRTALATTVKDAHTRQKYQPACVLLIASGAINQRAQEHIVEAIQDPRIGFLDSDTLIPDIDALMPELWFGIDATTVPYLRNLRKYLIEQSDTVDVSQLGVGAHLASPISEEAFVQLYLHRIVTKVTRERGVANSRPDLEQLPVHHILRRPERLILITGEAGSGKTTSLRRVALILLDEALAANKGAAIPVIFNATEAVRGQPEAWRLVDAVGRVAAKLTPEAKACFSRDALVAGTVTVLIDGFDELSSEAERVSLLVRIGQFHEQFPACRVLLTSRDYSFVERVAEHAPFVRYNISPINVRQAERMIDRLAKGQALSADHTRELLRRLENIHGMELNPLLVTVYVAATDYSRQDIPANITELFKKFTEMMLGRWDMSKGLAQQYHAPLKDFVLCKLAYHMHQERAVSWPLDRCLTVFRTELAARGLEADIDVLVEEMLHRSGLVRLEEGHLRFRHLLIQEFFAGRGLPSPQAIDGVISDTWWAKAIVFYFGQNPGHHEALLDLTQRTQFPGGEARYQAAVTVGLALQACYLARVTDKVQILRWVIQSLAEAKADYLNSITTPTVAPNLSFLWYYLYGRDAVACKAIREMPPPESDPPLGAAADADVRDTQVFWHLVGLVESGQLDQVEGILKGYRPGDTRLLLGVHLGCFYLWKMRYAPTAAKKAAEKLCARLAPKIVGLQQQVLDEMKGLLLEVQQGEVKVIKDGRPVG